MIFGLDKEEVDPSSLDNVPPNIHNVDLPSDIFQANRGSIRVDKLRAVEHEVVEPHSFGTDVGVKDLDWIRNDKWIDPAGVENPDEEDKSDGEV